MPITNVVVQVRDVARSVQFYQSVLSAVLVDNPTTERAVLDVVTATLELVRLGDSVPSPWVDDELRRGFRHIGFKVDSVDAYVDVARAAGAPMRLEPLDAVGDVRIAFFFDPDGTLVEILEGQLSYHVVYDEDAVAAELALGVPERPRFDHVCQTIGDLDTSESFWAELGFVRAGRLIFENDPRGFHIDYFRGGDSVVEAFSYSVPTVWTAPELRAHGFTAVQIPQRPYGGELVGEIAGRAVVSDPDGLLVMSD